jgi:hypothetical protein
VVAAIVFDAGALIALDRGDRALGAVLAVAALDRSEAITSSASDPTDIEILLAANDTSARVRAV